MTGDGITDIVVTSQNPSYSGVKIFPGRPLDFIDPFGNRVEIVQYDQIQFGKRDEVLRGMGLDHDKTDAAVAELREKGLAQ